jgi:hypothetical protein
MNQAESESDGQSAAHASTYKSASSAAFDASAPTAVAAAAAAIASDSAIKSGAKKRSHAGESSMQSQSKRRRRGDETDAMQLDSTTPQTLAAVPPASADFDDMEDTSAISSTSPPASAPAGRIDITENLQSDTDPRDVLIADLRARLAESERARLQSNSVNMTAFAADGQSMLMNRFTPPATRPASESSSAIESVPSPIAVPPIASPQSERKEISSSGCDVELDDAAPITSPQLRLQLTDKQARKLPKAKLIALLHSYGFVIDTPSGAETKAAPRLSLTLPEKERLSSVLRELKQLGGEWDEPLLTRGRATWSQLSDVLSMVRAAPSGPPRASSSAPPRALTRPQLTDVLRSMYDELAFARRQELWNAFDYGNNEPSDAVVKLCIGSSVELQPAVSRFLYAILLAHIELPSVLLFQPPCGAMRVTAIGCAKSYPDDDPELPRRSLHFDIDSNSNTTARDRNARKQILSIARKPRVAIFIDERTRAESCTAVMWRRGMPGLLPGSDSTSTASARATALASTAMMPMRAAAGIMHAPRVISETRVPEGHAEHSAASAGGTAIATPAAADHDLESEMQLDPRRFEPSDDSKGILQDDEHGADAKAHREAESRSLVTECELDDDGEAAAVSAGAAGSDHDFDSVIVRETADTRDVRDQRNELLLSYLECAYGDSGSSQTQTVDGDDDSLGASESTESDDINPDDDGSSSGELDSDDLESSENESDAAESDGCEGSAACEEAHAGKEMDTHSSAGSVAEHSAYTLHEAKMMIGISVGSFDSRRHATARTAAPASTTTTSNLRNVIELQQLQRLVNEHQQLQAFSPCRGFHPAVVCSETAKHLGVEACFCALADAFESKSQTGADSSDSQIDARRLRYDLTTHLAQLAVDDDAAAEMLKCYRIRDYESHVNVHLRSLSGPSQRLSARVEMLESGQAAGGFLEAAALAGMSGFRLRHISLLDRAPGVIVDSFAPNDCAGAAADHAPMLVMFRMFNPATEYPQYAFTVEMRSFSTRAVQVPSRYVRSATVERNGAESHAANSSHSLITVRSSRGRKIRPVQSTSSHAPSGSITGAMRSDLTEAAARSTLAHVRRLVDAAMERLSAHQDERQKAAIAKGERMNCFKCSYCKEGKRDLCLLYDLEFSVNQRSGLGLDTFKGTTGREGELYAQWFEWADAKANMRKYGDDELTTLEDYARIKDDRHESLKKSAPAPDSLKYAADAHAAVDKVMNAIAAVAEKEEEARDHTWSDEWR